MTAEKIKINSALKKEIEDEERSSQAATYEWITATLYHS